ncbi:MAG: hypothetical protein LIO99_03020 [Clostridiales bacterium]|nr:hypothetical protein [Clostridiales bacterium]
MSFLVCVPMDLVKISSRAHNALLTHEILHNFIALFYPFNLCPMGICPRSSASMRVWLCLIARGNWREALPETVRNLDSFIVYRAGSEPIEKAKYSISWTLLLDTAEWFAARHKHYRPQEKQHLYRATISADKVVAYLDDCGEFEIVQYRNVKNVEELPIRGTSPEYMDICEQEQNSRQAYEPHHSLKELYFNRWYREQIWDI